MPPRVFAVNYRLRKPLALAVEAPRPPRPSRWSWKTLPWNGRFGLRLVYGGSKRALSRLGVFRAQYSCGNRVDDVLELVRRDHLSGGCLVLSGDPMG